MGRLSDEELQAFFTSAGICTLACLDADGHPYVVPVGCFYRDGGFYIRARARAAWRTFLENDGRVCLSFGAEDPRIQVQGQAECVEGPVIGRGRVHDLFEERGRRDGWLDAPDVQAMQRSEPFYGFFVRPIKIMSWQGEPWAQRYKHADW